MKNVRKLLLPAMLLVLPLTASADSWKDERGHGKGRGHYREYKEEYWDGNCKVERKLSKHGDYKEERKCKGPSHGYYAPAPVVVVAPPPPPHVVVEPGVRVHGTISIRH